MSGASELALTVGILLAIVAAFLLRVGYLGTPEPVTRGRSLAWGWGLVALAVVAGLAALGLRDTVTVA